LVLKNSQKLRNKESACSNYFRESYLRLAEDKMSSNFCILIASKVFQVEKHFPEKLQAWVVDNFSNSLPDYSMLPLRGFRDNRLDNFSNSLPDYSILTLSEFRERQDVNLDLSEKLYSLYRVIDWGFYFMESPILRSFLSWLAEIYVYGEVGLLNSWSSMSSISPVRVGNIEENIWNLSANKLSLDKLLFFPLTSYSS